MLESLSALVMMQLKDKIDLSFTRSTKKFISKVILSILAVALVTAVIYMLFSISKMLGIFSLANIIPSSVVVVIFTIMQVLSIITCTYALMKNLYFAKDNQVLLTLPVTTNQIFISKLIVYYIYELIKNLYFVFPLFFAYGLIRGLPFLYYLWLPICLLFISLIPVCIGAFLSIFAMGLNMFIKNYNIIGWIIFTVLCGLGIYGIVYVIQLIPEDIDIIGSWGTLFWDIQDFLSSFVVTAYPFTKLVEMIVGIYSGLVPVLFTINTLYIFLAMIAFIVIMFGLSFLISKPLFFKMASTPFEYKRKIIDKAYCNKINKPFVSSVKKENRVLFRTSSEIYSMFGVAVALPILILLLNTIFASMSTKLLGNQMAISFNLLIILLLALASNEKMASVFSREGAAGYLMKTRPNSYHSNLIAKMITQMVVISISIIISVSIFASFSKLSVGNAILFGFSCLFIYLTHALWSAEMDIMNPQNMQYATTGTHISNPNETHSSIAMFFLAFLFFFVSLFLAMENIAVAWIKICCISVAFFGYHIWSFYNKIKYYYKEK